MIVAIDGPSGAGKSTVAKAAAKRLGFSCLDTGAMYRAIAWKALADGVSFDDADALGAIARDNEIEFGHVEGDPAVPAVREALVAQQQRIGRAGDYVVEGRDIGTVVFPEAPVKVFLTASAEERATRRVKQNEERHVGSTNYEEVLADIRKRDEIDSSRAASPLKPAEDAVHLDSTGKTIEEIISFICSRAEQAQG